MGFLQDDQQDATVEDNLLFPCSLVPLHVSSDIIAHHQGHLNCIYSFWYCSHVSLSAAVVAEPRQQQTATDVNKTRRCNYSLDAPDDER